MSVGIHKSGSECSYQHELRKINTGHKGRKWVYFKKRIIPTAKISGCKQKYIY